MIVSVARPQRPYADLSDLTTAEILRRGWVTDTAGDETYQVQFAVNVSAAVVDAVVRRMSTIDAVEETLYAQGETALATDRTFRDVTGTDIKAGADVIIGDTSITSTEVPGYLKDLARGVKALANYNESLARQNIALIRLVQGLRDATD